MVGCWDIHTELPNGYKFISEVSSIQKEYIVFEKSNSLKEQEANSIPCRILEYKFDKRYIIVKIKFHYDMYCVVGFNERKALKEGEIYYYILDTKKHIRYGAYENLTKFNREKELLNIKLKF